MRTALLGLTLLAGLVTTAARADEIHPYADLICNPATNIALVRFTEAYNDDPPVYDRLPAAIDHGLSARTGTGRRVCRLANGWEVKLRNGRGQAFHYGMGGGDPSNFFSLWVNGRKVISRRVWSNFGFDDERAPLAAVVVRPRRLTFCDRGDRIACRAQSLDVAKLPVDEVEYPSSPNARPAPGAMLITRGSDNPLCRSLVRRGPGNDGVVRDWIGSRAEEPDLPRSDAETEWIDIGRFAGENYQLATISDQDIVFGVERVPGRTSFSGSVPDDIDGDGVRDVVVGRSSDGHYFDGSFWVLAKQPTTVAEVLERLYPSGQDSDEERAIDRARQQGWSVYAGGGDGLYPKVSPRYVKLDMLHHDGATYFLAYPTNVEHDPTAIVIRPKSGGRFDTVCVFQRVRLNY